MTALTIPRERTEPQDTGAFLRSWKQEEFKQAQALGWFGVEPMEWKQGRVLSRQTGKEWPWTRERFYQASDLGWFQNERVERIKGEVYRKVSQNPPHFTILDWVANILMSAIGAGFVFRQQGPFPLPSDGDPEPDILVAQGARKDFVARHPGVSESVLVVEVSDTTLRYDKHKKAALYAEAGIADYWIVNLPDRTLEVRRDPERLSGEWIYQSVTVYTESQTVSLYRLPDVVISVAEIFSILTQQNP